MFGAPRVPSVEVTQVPVDAYLIDVRERDEWAQGHAEHAVHLPMSEFAGRLGEVPADCTVYVVCHVGARSAQVVAWLDAQGYDAVNVAGGMNSWAAAQLPMVGT